MVLQMIHRLKYTLHLLCAHVLETFQKTLPMGCLNKTNLPCKNLGVKEGGGCIFQGGLLAAEYYHDYCSTLVLGNYQPMRWEA